MTPATQALLFALFCAIVTALALIDGRRFEAGLFAILALLWLLGALFSPAAASLSDGGVAQTATPAAALPAGEGSPWALPGTLRSPAVCDPGRDAEPGEGPCALPGGGAA